MSDREAFNEIFSTFYNPVFYFVRKFIPDQDCAKDIVQDVFMELWCNRESIDPSIGFKSISLTIARNKCLNYLRKKSNFLKIIQSNKKEYLELSIVSLENESMNSLISEEFNNRLNISIENLPEKLREVFVLSRKSNLTNKQIALKLSVSEKTIEYRMTCVLRILRKTFRDVIK